MHRDHTQFSLPLIINFQRKQCSSHLKLPHIPTKLTLRSLPTNKEFWLVRVCKRLELESSQFANKWTKLYLLVLISLLLPCWLSNQLSLTIFRLFDVSNGWSRRHMTTRATFVQTVPPTTTFAPLLQGLIPCSASTFSSQALACAYEYRLAGIHSSWFVLSPGWLACGTIC